jgi:hypothetical protein
MTLAVPEDCAELDAHTGDGGIGWRTSLSNVTGKISRNTPAGGGAGGPAAFQPATAHHAERTLTAARTEPRRARGSPRGLLDDPSAVMNRL